MRGVSQLIKYPNVSKLRPPGKGRHIPGTTVSPFTASV